MCRAIPLVVINDYILDPLEPLLAGTDPLGELQIVAVCLVAAISYLLVEIVVLGYGFDDNLVGDEKIPVGGANGACTRADAGIEGGYCAIVVESRPFEEASDL